MRWSIPKSWVPEKAQRFYGVSENVICTSSLNKFRQIHYVQWRVGIHLSKEVHLKSLKIINYYYDNGLTYFYDLWQPISIQILSLMQKLPALEFTDADGKTCINRVSVLEPLKLELNNKKCFACTFMGSRYTISPRASRLVRPPPYINF